MKRIFVFVIALLAGMALSAQQNVKVETYRLDNGLKVILCEEHSQPKVHGCVVVHAGSVDENPNATGVAHYFEHIMFKGTDRIGTTDWAKESLYLDSISKAYDQLHATNDAQKRHDIQKEINRLNIAASKYAIPNEVDAILQRMGCTGLNAGTNYDYTVYYNTLPSNQLSNWMDVYVERFRNPVFRLFQSELEAVYEEKNMYENQTGYDFRSTLLKEAFGSHPYSRDIIGLGEHLKNPQPSEMQKFFDTYYVANNMTLILVGDFKTSEAKELIASKFSSWRSGKVPQRPKYDLPAYAGQRVVDCKLTPIKMGIMLMPGVPANHPDNLVLDMMSSILGGGSGLLDKATSDGRIMMAQLSPLSLQDAGSNAVIYVPNIIGQSHEDAEKVIWDCIDSIKQGRFTDELLESIKTSSIVDRQEMVEDYQSLSWLLLALELEGSSYEQWLKDNQRASQITRDEIIEVANKYFDRSRCTLIRSKMGFPKHDSAVKPDWDHLEAQNQGAKSPFALAIESNQPEPIKPQIIDYKNDVDIAQLTPNCKLYSVANPKNDVFRLELVYRWGEMDNPDLSRAMEYIRSIGAEGKDLQRFNLEMDLLGGSMGIYCDNDCATISISGLEQNIEGIMALAASRIFHPTHDAKQIKIIVDGIKANEKSVKNDADSWFSAMCRFYSYGENSSDLRQTPYKEWGTRTGEQLQAEVMQIFTRNGYATFSGNTDPTTLCDMIRSNGLVRDDVTVVPTRHWKRIQHDQPEVVYVSNKKFLQSDISFLVPTTDFDIKDQAVSYLFDEYFGGGMNSVVFQEIREFRSLGYSTYGYFNWDIKNLNPAYMNCYLGTQCDKTRDGVEAMRDLLVALPQRPDKLAPAIEHQVVARNSAYTTFRSLPGTVRFCMEERGWTYDRSSEITQQIGSLTMDDLQRFHDKYLKGRPVQVLISGNAKKFKVKEIADLLGPNTKVTELKYKQLFRF